VDTSIRSRTAAVAAGALLAAALPAGVAVAATATATSFGAYHSATYEGDPNPLANPPSVGMAAGGLWTIFTVGGPVTDERGAFQPWVQRTPKGLTVEASCAGPDALMKLPILYVGPSGGGTQINVYRPNTTPDEPWGTCAFTGLGHIRVTAIDGTVLDRSYVIVSTHPGPFLEPDGTAVGTYGPDLRLAQCRTDTADCPVSVGGRAAVIRIYLTGADQFTCQPCGTAGVTFYLDGKPQTLVRPGILIVALKLPALFVLPVATTTGSDLIVST